MKIWLIQVGEPLPIDNKGRDRLYRTGLLANYLIEAGHKVVWWTSDFYHQKKMNRFGEDKTIELKNGLKIILLHSIPYYKNISLGRVFNHWHLAIKFRNKARQYNPPDIILASYPTIELCVEAVKYGLEYNVPVVVDVRDLWPDIFLDVGPKILKPMLRIACRPFFKWAKYVFKNAYAITGVTEEYVEWGLKYGNRRQSDLDRSFPFGYPEYVPSEKEMSIAEKKWKDFGLDKSKYIISFFGTLGRQFDFNPVFEAADKLADTDILFVICGSGDNLENLKRKAQFYKNIIFPGWVSKAEIWLLMRYAKIGLAPYVNHKNFLLNLPNKPIEYFSAGLPVLSSIDGVLGNLLKKYNCGMVYGHSAEGLVECIVKLKNNPSLYKTLSQNARKLFEEKFSADRVYPAMVKYLEEVVINFRKRRKDVK